MAVTEAAAKSDEKNILEVCRLCLSDSHLVSFCSKEVADRDLLQKIWFNFRFHIVAIPGSPVPHVCKICIGLVEAFFTYFSRVIENQTYYENLINDWEKSDFYKYGKGAAERTKEAQQLAKEAANVLLPSANDVDGGGTNDKTVKTNGDKKGNVVNGDVTNRPKRPKKRKKVAVVPAPITPLPSQVKPSEFVKELATVGQQSVNRSSPTLTPKSFYRMPKPNVPYVRCIDNGEENAIASTTTTTTQEISLIDAQPTTSKTSLLLLKNEENNEQNQIQKSSKSIYHSMIKDAIKPIPKRLTFPSDAQFLPPKQPSPLPVPEKMDIDNVVVEKIDDTVEPQPVEPQSVEPQSVEPQPVEPQPVEPTPPSSLSLPLPPPPPSLSPPMKHVTGDMDEVQPPKIITGDTDELPPPTMIATPSKIPFSGGDGSAFYNYSEKIKLMGDDIDVITLNIITIKREPPDLPTDADGNLIPRQKRKRPYKRRRTDQQNQSQFSLPDSPKTVLRKKLDQLMPEYLHVKSDRFINDERIKMFYQLTCPICPLSLTTEDNQENPLPPKQFETFKDILIHCEKVHNEPGYIICCNRKLYRKDRVLTHMTLHENPDAFKCPDCGHKSQSKPLLRIHMKVHLPLDEGGLRRVDGAVRKKRLGRPGISTSNSEFNIYPAEQRTADDVPMECESMVVVKKEEQEVSDGNTGAEIKQEPLEEVIKEVEEQQPNQQKQVELSQNIPSAEMQQLIHSAATITQPQLQPESLVPFQLPSQSVLVSELPAPVKIEPIENNDNLIDNNTNAIKMDVIEEESVKPVKLGRGKYIRVKRPTENSGPIKKRQKRTSTTTITTPKAETASESTEETTAEAMAEANAIPSTTATPSTTTKAKIKTKRKPAGEKQELLGEYFCNRCDAKFDKKSQLTLHLVEVHKVDPINPYECNQCNGLFADVAALRAHELAVHGKYSTHICTYCNKEFKIYRALYAHIRNVHLQVKNFACNLCDKRFRRRLELAEHLARHSGEVLYKCPYCSQTFGARTNYLNHHRKKHKDQQIADILTMLDTSTTLAADITTIVEDKTTRKKSVNSLTDLSNNDISGGGGGVGVSSSSFSHVTGDDDIDHHYNPQNQNNDTTDGNTTIIPPMNLYSMPKLLSSEEIVRTVIGPVSCTIVSGENNRLLQINNDGNVKVEKQNNIDIDDIETQIDTHVVGDMSSRKFTVNNDEINNLTTNSDANVNGNINAA